MQICTLLSSLDRVSCQLGSATEQNHWLGLPQDTTSMNLVCQCSWLLQAPSSFSISVRYPLVKPCIFPHSNCRARSEQGVPQSDPDVWGTGCSSLGSLFLLEELEIQELETPLHIVWNWPGVGSVQSVCSCFSYSSTAVCLGLWCRGVGQPQHCIFFMNTCQFSLFL